MKFFISSNSNKSINFKLSTHTEVLVVHSNHIDYKNYNLYEEDSIDDLHEQHYPQAIKA